MAKCSSWGLSMSSSVKNVGSSRIFLYSWNKDCHDTSRVFLFKKKTIKSPAPFHSKAVRKCWHVSALQTGIHDKVIAKLSG